jgi:hypothetical protein
VRTLLDRRIPSRLAALALILFLWSARAFAQGYPPYAGPYAAYGPLDLWPPSGAALGPWRWTFDFGGGPTSVIGGSRDQLTNGWNINFGGGYNFTPRVGMILEFMNAGLGVTDAALQQNQATDGDAHVWSVTLNPVWRFRIGGPVGAYLIGGGGFYEREMIFDEPVQVFVPSFGGGFFVPGTETVRQTDDAGGVNVGGGITCNLGWGTKLFVEARYHHIFTSGGATRIIPVSIGLRW